MKKLFTLCAAIVMGCMAASAQTDNTFQFVDKDGNVVADGTTWHAYEKENDIFYGTIIPSGLYVKNTTSETANCSLDFQVTQISGSKFLICYPKNCISNSGVTEVISTGTGEQLANESKDLQSEWVVKPFGADAETTGTCTVTLQLKVMQQIKGTFQYEVKAYGPKITVVFHNDGPTDGISGAEAAGGKEPVAYYSVDGRRLGVAQKGLNIVKYADGTTAKVVVR